MRNKYRAQTFTNVLVLRQDLKQGKMANVIKVLYTFL